MVTINLESLRAGAVMPRASVNGMQFVEAEKLRAGAVMPQTPILSSEDVHAIKSWTPADNSIGNQVGGPVTVNFEAVKGALFALDFTDGESFDDDGTHDGTVSIATALALATSGFDIDFENYNGGVLTTGQPNSWTTVSPIDYMQLWVDPLDASNLCVRALYWNDWLGLRLDDAGGANLSGEMSIRFMIPSTANGEIYLGFGITGSGSAMRGHFLRIQEGSNYALFGRWNAYNNTSSIRIDNFGFVPALNTWYNLKVQFWTTVGVTTGCNYKVWQDGTTEPTSWRFGGSDTAYAQAGHVAMHTHHTSQNPIFYLDDFKFAPSPPVYGSSGHWESDPLEVTAAEIAAGHRINFTATTPANTTAIVKCKWRDSGAWLTCSDGEKLAGLLYRELMRTGSAREKLYLRIDLATTDPSATPTIDDLVINFDPCIFDDVELVVDDQVATIDNGHLAQWGREQISAGVIVDAFDDLTVQAHSFASYKLHGEALVSTFKYDEFPIGDIVFSQLLQAFRLTSGGKAYFAFRAGAIEGRADAQWTATDIWTPSGKDYEWTLIDYSQGIHADAQYIVGYVVIDDYLGSLLVGEAQENDFLGSLLVRGYRRDDFLGSLLVQGWTEDDFLGSVLPATIFENDFLGSVVVGERFENDFLGSVVVFGVNRDNKIEIKTVDVDTAARLKAIGFIFPPKGT